MDSYRPRGGGDGDYRPRPGPDYGNGDSYRPGWRDDSFRPPPRDANESNGMYYFRGSRDEDFRRREPYRSRQREPFRRNAPHRGDHFRHPKVAERPLLRLAHRQEDSSLIDPNADFKFRNVEDLTDSEEEAMAVSDNEEPARSTKRARLEDDDAIAESSKARWSNPDPYTALPPPSEAAAKRTDVLRLIRKARIDANLRSESASEQADFISFDMDDTETSVPESLPTLPVMGAASSQPVAPVQPSAVPVQAPGVVDDGVLGKRKRGDDIGKHTGKSQMPASYYGDRFVRKEWYKSASTSSTPWLSTESSSDLAGVALHKEIIDFYNWVKPKPYEQEVRDEVFQRLRREFRRCGPPGDLYAFGSYAAGLYLPTGDMDIVYITSTMRPGAPPSREAARPLIRRFHDFLRSQRIAKPGSILAILGAKVPLLKFVDRISGLKIDLSFDNDSGITAIETFHRWKNAYPAMPIIVSIVKQYLMMRGLNDVSTGGLGGFSTICLVTSLLQHLPVLTEPLNLGEVLLEFFNLYGNIFDRRDTAIRMEPPAYLDKSTYLPQLLKKDKSDSRLTIIDPNRPDNNISGGTNQIADITRCFSSAHQALLGRLDMYDMQYPKSSPVSFLECLLGGNFSSYESQRKILYDLSLKLLPPPSSLTSYSSKAETTKSNTSASLPAPPSHPLPQKPHWETQSAGNLGSGSAAQQSALNGNNENMPNGEVEKDESKLSSSEKRALRFKRLRPDLASSVGRTLGPAQAMSLGGYLSKDAMHKDLNTRELALNSKKK
ncbi:hypothetical protein PV08_00456 [Exophiala spinifera]|uniref:polynucleotide adenylyltransferase n=1 Tax=Exophiala spinifera TaxID=91928 RepID=A0A0D1YX66_9EURO|nr:uncharacterized protein PV08_00456 [Exophiala spinifera]KIW19881.1 hypothetical protein PV08_00456 [Exophiala spinifera]